jgi:hypothetical protein
MKYLPESMCVPGLFPEIRRKLELRLPVEMYLEQVVTSRVH